MSDYYVVMRANNNNNPLLGWRQTSGMFYKGKPVEIDEPIKLGIGDPIPNNPEMVDYHSLPESVVSDKIKNVLEPMNIEGIQLVPAKVEGVNEGEVYDYWLIHIFNEIACLDRNLSKYDIDEDDDEIDDITKVVLDEKVLKEIPLEKRLVFLLGESTSKQLFHKSIRDAIMAQNPQGIRFINVDEWTDGSSFE